MLGDMRSCVRGSAPCLATLLIGCAGAFFGSTENRQQQGGQDQGQGPGRGRPGRQGQARADNNTDPLGRPLRGRDYGDDVTVKVPGEIDVQRARRILEELRKRLADPARPQLELDYIERLLKDF